MRLKATKDTASEVFAVSFVALADNRISLRGGGVDQQVQRAEIESLKPNPTLQEQNRNMHLLTIYVQFYIIFGWRK